jgi:tetratricopeptide (TPR) repeat protein
MFYASIGEGISTMKALQRLAIAMLAASPFIAAAGAVTRPAPQAFSHVQRANELFLRAREQVAKSDPRTGGTFANGREAIKLYEQAIDADPTFALAYVEMAKAYLTLGYSNPGAASDAETLPPVRAAIAKALSIDPNLADAHLLAAAVAYFLDYKWDTADREYRRGLELAPGNAAGHANYAAFLGTQGRFDEALHQAHIADALEPSATSYFAFARIYFWKRDYASAIGYCQHSLARQDNFAVRFYLALMYSAAGRYDKAIPEFKATTKENNAGAEGGLAYGYALSGDADRARALLEKLFAGGTYGPPVAYRVAAVYVALGDKTKAIQWLNASYERHENWMPLLKVDPAMDPLRSDDRFQALMRKMAFE